MHDWSNEGKIRSGIEFLDVANGYECNYCGELFLTMLNLQADRNAKAVQGCRHIEYHSVKSQWMASCGFLTNLFVVTEASWSFRHHAMTFQEKPTVIKQESDATQDEVPTQSGFQPNQNQPSTQSEGSMSSVPVGLLADTQSKRSKGLTSKKSVGNNQARGPEFEEWMQRVHHYLREREKQEAVRRGMRKLT